MTYRTTIGACDGFIDRNQYTYNNYIVDDRQVYEQGYDVDVYEADILSKINSKDYNTRFILQGIGIKAVNP